MPSSVHAWCPYSAANACHFLCPDRNVECASARPLELNRVCPVARSAWFDLERARYLKLFLCLVREHTSHTSCPLGLFCSYVYVSLNMRVQALQVLDCGQNSQESGQKHVPIGLQCTRAAQCVRTVRSAGAGLWSQHLCAPGELPTCAHRAHCRCFGTV